MKNYRNYNKYNKPNMILSRNWDNHFNYKHTKGDTKPVSYYALLLALSVLLEVITAYLMLH